MGESPPKQCQLLFIQTGTKPWGFSLLWGQGDEGGMGIGPDVLQASSEPENPGKGTGADLGMATGL